MAHAFPACGVCRCGECACRHPFLAVDADREAFLGFALKVLLYQPPATLLRAAPATPLDAPAAGVRPAPRWRSSARGYLPAECGRRIA